MPDSKITALTSISTSTDPANDPLVIVDLSDTSMAATGTTKKVTLNQLLATSPTATLASATITGDLTVDTNTLFVDAANNRVGIGTASPANPFDVVSASGTIALFKRTGSNSAFIGIQDASGSFSYLGSTNGTFAIQTPGSGYSDKYTIASDGTAIWYVGGSEAMRLNSTGLGVGTSPSAKLDVYQATLGTAYFRGGYSARQLTLTATSDGSNDGAIHTFSIGSSAGQFLFANSGGTRLTIDSSGNVGVGVTPSAGGTGFYKTFEIGKVGCGLFVSTAGLSSAENTYFSGNAVLKYNSGPEWSYGNAGSAGIYGIEDGVHKWYNAVSGSAGGVFTPTQAMTLDASGNLLVGTTSALIASSRRLSVVGTVAAALQSTGAATVEAVNVWHTATTGNNIFIDFDTEASVTSRGSISYNRSGGLVAYNTTSDYRAKDIIGPVSNSGSVIDSLKVYIGKMKGATVERPMLVAHEAQTVAPYAVTGEKDAVDVDGNPRYQQMDVSSFVPLLIAEIQSLRTRVAALEA
jgi:hypothetical protein